MGVGAVVNVLFVFSWWGQFRRGRGREPVLTMQFLSCARAGCRKSRGVSVQRVDSSQYQVGRQDAPSMFPLQHMTGHRYILVETEVWSYFPLRFLPTDVAQKSSRAGQQKNVSAKPVNTLLPPQLRGR